MTNIIELFSGIGIIIDDEINKNGTPNNIQKIVLSLRGNNIPLIYYENLPDKKDLYNFRSVSFVLLDWNLSGMNPIPNVTIDDNIQFLQDLKALYFCPIFIFSDESPDSIIAILESNNLYSKVNINNIFVKSKADLDTSEKLFESIENWLRHSPAMYVLKEWENTIFKAQNQMFNDFYSLNQNWVNVLFSSSEKDEIDFSYEIYELLFNNLFTRGEPLSIDTQYFNRVYEFSPSEIRKVIQGRLMLGVNNLNPNMIFTGDVYKINDDYFINVRPQCDCIQRKKNATIDDIKLYLIKGLEKDVNKCSFNKKNGNFSDIENRVTIYPIDDKAIQFCLSDFSIDSFGNIKNFRIGRLLAPYITRLIQKYALYMQRQGLPRLPEEAIQ